MEVKNEVSTLDILKDLPSEEISLDIDNLILIISTWKKELAMQQMLNLKLKSLEKTNYSFTKKNVYKDDSNLIKINKKIYSPHRGEPLKIELWKNKKTKSNKDLVIFMPGLGGNIDNFRWIGIELSKRGWPVLFLSLIHI